jgi:hypothetical protein
LLLSALLLLLHPSTLLLLLLSALLLLLQSALLPLLLILAALESLTVLMSWTWRSYIRKHKLQHFSSVCCSLVFT